VIKICMGFCVINVKVANVAELTRIAIKNQSTLEVQ